LTDFGRAALRQRRGCDATPNCRERGAVLGGVKLWVLAMLAALKKGGCAWLRSRR
jgi:hypothetical protein